MKANKLLLATRHPAAVPLPFEGELPSLSGATAWLNSPPLSAADLRGKVVLIDFWTYTCINWLRTLPYVRAWAEKYREHGVVVIGAHSPEFSFEHDLDNVRRAAKDMRVSYPIAIDNDYAIWDAFENHYWPALYLVDAQGRIRSHQFGEGAYEQSEMMIQQLLAEAGRGGIAPDLVSVDAQGAEVAADWGSLRSPENYVGDARTENFSSPGGAVLAQPRVYTTPEIGRCPGGGSGRRWGEPPVSRKRCRGRAHREFFVSRWGSSGSASRLYYPRSLLAQSLGPCR